MLIKKVYTYVNSVAGIFLDSAWVSDKHVLPSKMATAAQDVHKMLLLKVYHTSDYLSCQTALFLLLSCKPQLQYYIHIQLIIELKVKFDDQTLKILKYYMIMSNYVIKLKIKSVNCKCVKECKTEDKMYVLLCKWT